MKSGSNRYHIVKAPHSIEQASRRKSSRMTRNTASDRKGAPRTGEQTPQSVRKHHAKFETPVRWMDRRFGGWMDLHRWMENWILGDLDQTGFKSCTSVQQTLTVFKISVDRITNLIYLLKNMQTRCHNRDGIHFNESSSWIGIPRKLKYLPFTCPSREGAFSLIQAS